MCEGTIRANDLRQRVRDYTAPRPEAVSSETEPVIEDWVTLSEIEGRYVARVLEHTGGNKQAAARVLAVDRKTLDRMIKRHHIDAQRARSSDHKTQKTMQESPGSK
jgi:two-component system, NtrC family, response regulator AtoC